MLETVNTEVLVHQIMFAEGIGAAIITGLFALLLKHFERRGEEKRLEAEKKAAQEREDDRKKAAEDRKADLAYRKEREEREKLKRTRDALMYDMAFASANGVDVLLRAAHGEKVNGNVDKALESLDEAMSKCNHFVNDNAARL